MKTRLLIIPLVFFGLIGTVHAVPELDPTHAFDYSETVVIGKILSVDILSEPQITRTENYYSEVSGIALYEVEIDEYLKNSSEDNIITVPGLFLREPHAMAYETYPYEIGQQVLLYLQENTHGFADTKLIIRSGDSKVIENGLCVGDSPRRIMHEITHLYGFDHTFTCSTIVPSIMKTDASGIKCTNQLMNWTPSDDQTLESRRSWY